MGYSRDTFYRYKELYDNGGEEALRELVERSPYLQLCCINKNQEYMERKATADKIRYQ